MKKLLALVQAVILCLGILAGCAPAVGGNETTAAPDETTAAPDETTAPEAQPLFAEEVTIQMWMPNNSDLETEGSYANLAIEKTVNAKIEITEYDEQSQFDTLMAEKKVPMLLYSNGLITGQTYGPDGAFINWYDYVDQLPNIKAMLEDERWEADIQKHTYADGVMYSLPIPQTGYANVYGYIYRQDIFEANDLEFPTTLDEFYNTLVKLKKLYPDSYPFVMRTMNGNMQGLEAFAYPWGTNHQLISYYNSIMKFDHEKETYYFAQTSDQMKECIAFLNKLDTEDLMHPSSLSMDTAQWQEAMTSGKSFITYDKMDRIPALMGGADLTTTPDFVLTGGAPIAMGSKGVAACKVVGPTNYNFLVSNLMEEEDLNNVLKYVDWLYSEEGILVSNWGIQGESYQVNEDGSKSYLDSFTYAGSGLGVCSLCGYRDFDAYLASLDENVANALKTVLPYATSPGDPILKYTEDEQTYMDTYFQALYDASLANLQKFILGQRDIETEWDDYIAEMEALNMQELIDVHQDAYERDYK